MKFRASLAIAALLATTGLVRAETDPGVAGFWEAKDDAGHTTAWFLFSEKNGVYSARLVKGFKPADATDDKPPPDICEKCPGKKKGAHIMGLTLFWGMKRDGHKYRDGSVLDPRDGSVYHALMDLSEDGQDLSVRGYLGIPLLGKTQVWHRLPDDAMKKDDIPKERLAGADPAAGDKAAEKPKHTAAAKHKKKDDTDAAAASPDAPAKEEADAPK